MPCTSIIKIGLDKPMHIETLIEALKRLGITVYGVAGPVGSRVVDFAGGSYREGGKSLDVSSSRLADKIRPAYTREVAAKAALRQGFKVEYDQKDPAVLRITSDGRVL